MRAVLAILFSALVCISAARQQRSPVESPSTPEMTRLVHALAGEWKTVETMQKSLEFPNGGSRHGSVSVRLLAGGTTLFYGVHSDGSAGKLDGFHLIWWDKKQGTYLFFACFNNPVNPCHPRGTAHWENDHLVNDYEESAGGKSSQWKDTFLFSPGKHTLIAAMRGADGQFKTQITTVATRH